MVSPHVSRMVGAMASPTPATALPPPAAAGDDADRAIARVLAAERDARIAVAACAEQAGLEVQQARDRARLIAARAGERNARILAAIAGRLQQRLAAIDAQRQTLAAPAGESAAGAWRRAKAVERLAAELSAPAESRR